MYELDPISSSFKISLKSWIRLNIPVDRGTIFIGRVNMKEKTDWLSMDVEEMKKEWTMKLRAMKNLKNSKNRLDLF